LDATAEIGAKTARDLYVQWAEQHGLNDRERMSATAFGRRMSDRFPHTKKRNGKVYQGLREHSGGEV